MSIEGVAAVVAPVGTQNSNYAQRTEFPALLGNVAPYALNRHFLPLQDLSKLTFDDVEPDSPEEMLNNLKEQKTTYADVYQSLCRYVHEPDESQLF